MEKRDLLEKQIEQVGRVLGKILAATLETPVTGDLLPGLDQRNQQLREQLDLDVDALGFLDGKALESYLLDGHLSPESIEMLAAYLLYTDKPAYFPTALKLLDTVDALTGDYSFKRAELRARITQALTADS